MGVRWSYTDEIAEEICTRLANGESLIAICEDSHMPGRRTVLDWCDADPAFRLKCARARDQQADHAYDELIGIERKLIAGEMSPEVARVVVASKQWRAMKMAPRRYGDKSSIETKSTVEVQHTRKLDISTLTDEQLDALEGALRATVAQLAPPTSDADDD